MYGGATWDQRKINNVNPHFVTAFLGEYLKGKDMGDFLDIPEDSNIEDWPGFKPRSSTGMELLHGESMEAKK